MSKEMDESKTLDPLPKKKKIIVHQRGSLLNSAKKIWGVRNSSLQEVSINSMFFLYAFVQLRLQTLEEAKLHVAFSTCVMHSFDLHMKC